MLNTSLKLEEDLARTSQIRVIPPPSTAAALTLDDGTVWAGTSFGADVAVRGEVVFCTAMAGYIEALTDPSFRGQILVLTYPLIGSYGVPAPRAASSLDGPFESSRIQVAALIVQQAVDTPSHHLSERTLAAWLQSEGVPGIQGIDTRSLTRLLRARGTMPGKLSSKADPDALVHETKMDEVSALVTPREVVRYDGGKKSVLLVDAGAKDNLVRSLLERGLTVIRAPIHADLRALAQQVDGIVVGSGPGDPCSLMPTVEVMRGWLSSFHGPIFGVCLGSQLLSLAAGARTFKLPYGHRGINQPVVEVGTKRALMTSQNHGYAVDDSTLPNDWTPWFRNLNDGTNEGVRCKTRPAFAVQFHPEARPGPADTAFVFDEFVTLLDSAKRPA